MYEQIGGREISKDNADNMALWQKAKFISGSGKVSSARLCHFEEMYGCVGQMCLFLFLSGKHVISLLYEVKRETLEG